MFVSTFGGELQQFVTQSGGGDVYSNKEILLQQHKSFSEEVIE